MNRIEDTFTIEKSQKGIVDRIPSADLVKNEYLPNWIETEEFIYTSFTSPYPSIEIKAFTAGKRAVIRGTRISVGTIISYLLMGEKPKTIIEEILPNVSLLQIIDAIKYYQTYKSEINNEINENTEDDLREHYNQFWSFSGQKK